MTSENFDKTSDSVVFPYMKEGFDGREFLTNKDNFAEKRHIKSIKIFEMSEVNSSFGETFRPFKNFEHSQTHSLASRSKFSKEAKAFTASRRLDKRSEVPNTRILGESQGDSSDSADSSENNTVFARLCKKPKQSINTNISAESRRSERVESQKDFNNSAESAKDSNVLDCHDSATQNLAMTAEGDSVESAKMDSHAKTCGLSHNDAPLSSLRGSPQGLTKQSIKDSINSSDFVDSSDSKNAMDCHEALTSRNDGDFLYCHDLTSSNLAMKKKGDSVESNRHCERAKQPKQSINANNLAESRQSERVESAKDSIKSNDSADSSNATAQMPNIANRGGAAA